MLRYGDVDQRDELRQQFEKAYRLEAEIYSRTKRGETASAARFRKELDQPKKSISEKYGSSALTELENDLESVIDSMRDSKKQKKKQSDK